MIKNHDVAKITMPQVNYACVNKRLFKLVDQARKNSLIWVFSPEGYGKTTLVASYIQEHKPPCLWYSFEAGDGVTSFYDYLALAGKNSSPRRRRILPRYTEENLTDLSAYNRDFFYEWLRRIQTPGVIVFDNYHNLPIKSPLHQLIAEAMQQLPEGLNIIFISRTEPPFEFARLHALSNSVYIGWKDLRLTLDESKCIAKRMIDDNDWIEKNLPEIYTLTQGWIAGLQILLKQSKASDASLSSIIQSSYKVIFDYFNRMVYQNADQELQDFLLKTAVLDEMSVEIAKQLTGNPNAKQIFLHLAKEQYFINRDTDSSCYIYHPLFRLFLIDQLKASMSELEFNMLQHRAALLFVQNNNMEEAVKLMKSSGDWVKLTELIIHQAPMLINQGRHATLEQCLRCIPELLAYQEPWLLYWLGACRLNSDASEARYFFEQSYDIFQKDQDASGLYLSWAGVVNCLIHEWSDYKVLDQWIDAFSELQQKFSEFPSIEIEITTIAAVISAMLFRQPKHETLASWVCRGRQLLVEHGYVENQIPLAASLNLYYAWMGEMAKFDALVNDLRSIAINEQVTPFARVACHFYLAMWGWQRADWESCDNAIIAGKQISEQHGIYLLDHELNGQNFYAITTSGRFDEAKIILKELQHTILFEKPLMRGHINYLSAWVGFMTGELERASEQGKLALALSQAVGIAFPEGLNHLGLSQIYFELNKKNLAQHHLKDALRIANITGSQLLLFQGLCLKALYAYKNKEYTNGLVAVRKAFAVASHADIINYPWWRADVMAGLCSKALLYDVETNFVKRLIRKRHLLPPDHVILDNWPWPIKVYTLGRFSLLIDDVPVHFKNKAQHRPLNLLKALIAFGGRDISVKKIIDAFWPDSEADNAHSAFTMALKRLRKLLVYDEAVKLSDGCISLDPRYCWIDTWDFERMAGEKFNPQKIEAAISLYHGSFLNSDIDAFWALSMRKRLGRKFLGSIIELAQYWEVREEWDIAISLYQRGLEVDELEEIFYQRLMVCYKQLGQKGEIKRIYQDCLEILNCRLGVHPSEQTEKIYSELH